MFTDESRFCLDSQIGVLEFGENEVNGFRLQMLLSMTVTEVGQLWYGEALAGMSEPTRLYQIEAHWQFQRYMDDILDNQVKWAAGKNISSSIATQNHPGAWSHVGPIIG